MLYTLFSNVVIAGVEDPVLREGLRDEDVTPGIFGFLATFAFVIAAIIVFRIMIRQIRRVKLRSTTAEDMPAERHQADLPEDARQRSQIGDPGSSQTARPRKKYTGHPRNPTLAAPETQTR